MCHEQLLIEVLTKTYTFSFSASGQRHIDVKRCQCPTWAVVVWRCCDRQLFLCNCFLLFLMQAGTSVNVTATMPAQVNLHCSPYRYPASSTAGKPQQVQTGGNPRQGSC